jgi:hypothetical protein
MRLLRSFLRLTGVERRLLAQATVLLVLVRIGVGRLPFTTLRRLAMGRRRSIRAARPDQAWTNMVVWAVDAADRRMPGQATCLTRALTVQAMLARAGNASRLQVGVIRSVEGKLEAHAWVECDGRVLVGGSPSEVERFTPLAAFDVEKSEPAPSPPTIQPAAGAR